MASIAGAGFAQSSRAIRGLDTALNPSKLSAPRATKVHKKLSARVKTDVADLAVTKRICLTRVVAAGRDIGFSNMCRQWMSAALVLRMTRLNYLLVMVTPLGCVAWFLLE